MNSKAIILIILIILVVALGVWYFFFLNYKTPQPIPEMNQTPATGQSNNQVTGNGDQIIDITSDFNQVPNDSAVNSETDSLNQSINSF